MGRDETLEEVATRIQAKLGVSDEEFAKWKFAYVVSLRPPEYLQPGDVVASKVCPSFCPHPLPPSLGDVDCIRCILVMSLSTKIQGRVGNVSN